MAEYRNIHTRIWKDEWFSELDEDAKLLFIYLFSNERASVCGMYELPIKFIVFETGLERRKVEKIMSEFESSGKVFYKDGVVWVVNLQKYNDSGQSAKVAVRIQKDLQSIPDCEIKRKYYSFHNIPYPETKIGYPENSSETDTETETETEKETDTDTGTETQQPAPTAAEIEAQVLAYWQTLFPSKPQPRPGTYRAKIETRWKSQHFQDNWKTALDKSSLSPTCQNESWFDFEFFIRNEENYQKMLAGWMAWKDQEEYGTAKPNGSGKRLSKQELVSAAFGVGGKNGNN